MQRVVTFYEYDCYGDRKGYIDLNFQDESVKRKLIDEGHMKSFIFMSADKHNLKFIKGDDTIVIIYTHGIASVIPILLADPYTNTILEKLKTGQTKRVILYGEDMDFLTVGGCVPDLVKQLNDYFGEYIDKFFLTCASKNWDFDWGNINIIYNMGCVPYFIQNNYDRIEERNISLYKEGKPKYFFTTNNQPRAARMHLYKFMIENGLIDKSEASFFFKAWEHGKTHLSYSDRESEGHTEYYPIIDDTFQFPVKVFENELRGGHFYNCKWINFDKNIDCMIDIVIETLQTADNFFSFSEKAFRPIICKKPFIIFGTTGLYKGMKELGFKFFPFLYDENELERTNITHEERLAIFLKMIKNISEMGLDELQALINQYSEIYEYNYNLLVSIVEKEKDDLVNLW
jgi:hypothetical protein